MAHTATLRRSLTGLALWLAVCLSARAQDTNLILTSPTSDTLETNKTLTGIGANNNDTNRDSNAVMGVDSSTAPYQLWLTFSNNLLMASGLATNCQPLYAGDETTLPLQDDEPDEENVSQIVFTLARKQSCYVPTNLAVYNISTTSAYLSWSYAFNTQYQLRYRPVGTTTWTTSTTLSSSSYSLTELSNGITYETQVQTVCSATNVSDYTNSTTFTTGCFLPFFQYTNSTSTSAYLYWEGGGGGVQYELNYRVVGVANWISVSGLTTNRYILTGLTNSTNYEFRVRALCSGGITSDFTIPTRFRTNCNIPGNLDSSDHRGTTARIFWSGVADGQTRYEVRYRPVNNPSWITATNPASTTTIGRYLISLTPNTAYEVQVRTLCGDGNSSAFTASHSFTTLGCSVPFALYSYNTSVSGTVLSWENGETSSTYALSYRPVGSTT
jgi:trimeric autotransporter adhesin